MPFKAYRGVTQGSPLSTKLFNILVNAVVQEGVQHLQGEWDRINELRWSVEVFLALFYADDSLVVS